jgi:hypothetical protein
VRVYFCFQGRHLGRVAGALGREDAVHQPAQAVWYCSSRKSSLGERCERFSLSMPTT